MDRLSKNIIRLVIIIVSSIALGVSLTLMFMSHRFSGIIISGIASLVSFTCLVIGVIHTISNLEGFIKKELTYTIISLCYQYVSYNMILKKLIDISREENKDYRSEAYILISKNSNRIVESIQNELKDRHSSRRLVAMLFEYKSLEEIDERKIKEIITSKEELFK